MADRQQLNNPIAGVYQRASNAGSATTGVKLTYTCPAGRNAMVRCMSVSNVTGGTPTINAQLTLNASTVSLISSAAQFLINPNMPLNAGDTAVLNVTVAAVGSSFDGIIGVEEYLIN